jgi:hypothetical protein
MQGHGDGIRSILSNGTFQFYCFRPPSIMSFTAVHYIVDKLGVLFIRYRLVKLFHYLK